MSESKARLLKERDEWRSLFFQQAKYSECIEDARSAMDAAVDAIDAGNPSLARQLLLTGSGGDE